MKQLNYHHLLYFYHVTQEGSITQAAKKLHLTPQTVSGQLSSFEGYLGFELFERKGKRLFLSERGRVAFSYAEDIFALGNELQQALSQSESAHQINLAVGVTDVIPKIFAFDLLNQLFDMEEDIKLNCREGEFDLLLGELAISRLDFILSDRPVMPGSAVKAFSHLLGETGLTFYSDKRLTKKMQKNFPYSLDQAPFLISGDKSNLKTNLTAWFGKLNIHPKIVAEFDDTALMKCFGQAGRGVFCTPSTVKEHIVNRYNVGIIGSTKEVTERYYAISPERKVKHPGTQTLIEKGKQMFACLD